MWVLDGRGSYEWDDDRYREEVGPVMREVLALCASVISGSGTLAIAAFHPEMAVADEYRTDLRKRAEALEGSLQELVRSYAEWITKKQDHESDRFDAALDAAEALLRGGERMVERPPL